MTSWKEAYQLSTEDSDEFTVRCLYEDVPDGSGDSPEQAREDFLENIRLKINELTEMLQFCATNQPRLVKSTHR